jgi:hypothetical protein
MAIAGDEKAPKHNTTARCDYRFQVLTVIVPLVAKSIKNDFDICNLRAPLPQVFAIQSTDDYNEYIKRYLVRKVDPCKMPRENFTQHAVGRRHSQQS